MTPQHKSFHGSQDLGTSTIHSHLVPAHGGELIDLYVNAERGAELKAGSKKFPSWDLTSRQICDLELLLNGGFSPLCGFMTRAEYESVCHNMRLTTGFLWPIPVVLDVSEAFAKSLKRETSKIVLRDGEGVMLAVLHVEDVWQPDHKSEAEAVFRTNSTLHPGVNYLLNKANPWYVGGRIEGLESPSNYDFKSLRLTPAELREEFAQRGWRRVVAFQTRNPMHRAHVEMTIRAAKQVEASLLIHPAVGMTNAGPGKDADGKSFYEPYEAQELFKKYEAEIGVTMVPFHNMVYVEDKDTYLPENEVPKQARVLSISGTELRRRLNEGRDLPGWFTYPDVAEELRRSFPPRHKQGLTVFFSGLSGSGKSTIANVLLIKFHEIGGRPVTLFDGDLVRKHLSSELGFSKEHRDLNIRRIGYVASEITKNRGIAICAPIAPYDATRKEVRSMIEPLGGFLMVHLSTPIEVCEQRDRKGLYAKARAGIIKEFTGVSDPYEEPKDAEVVINTAELSPEEAAQEIILHLEREGFIGESR